MSVAIVRKSDGRVLTFVRDDVPAGWKPAEGYEAVPADQLPEGWQRVDAEPQRKIWPNAQSFMEEFTMQELGMIANHTDANLVTLRFILTTWHGEVWADDPRVVGAMQLLQGHGIIDAERSAQILTA